MVLRSKQEVRHSLLTGEGGRQAARLTPGAIAERVRKLPGYGQATQLFVTPEKVLTQIRINTLLDGKELIMPGPGMREGFFRIRPYMVPFADLGFAVTYKGLPRYAERLKQEELARLRISLLVTRVLAVDGLGYWLGDGKGFFDLAYALLAASGGLAAGNQVVVVADQGDLESQPLAPEPWDIRADWLLAGDVRQPAMAGGQERGPVTLFWERLSLDRIKRITPLWKLYNRERDRGML